MVAHRNRLCNLPAALTRPGPGRYTYLSYRSFRTDSWSPWCRSTSLTAFSFSGSSWCWVMASCEPTANANIPSITRPPSVGETLELTIESMAYGGAGVARHERLVVLVDGGVTGDRVAATLTHCARTFARARVLQILSPSPLRREPACRHFPRCGGCVYQNLAEADQREIKRRQVRDLLERVGRFPNPPVRPVLASPSPFHYRNRMRYAVPREQGAAPGLHGRWDPREVLEVSSCLLPRPDLQDTYRTLLDDLRPLAAGERPSQIEIQGGAEGTRPIAVLTGMGPPSPRILHLAARWCEPEGPLAGVVWMPAIAGRRRRLSGEVRLLAGEDRTIESLAAFRLAVPAGCFFQANPDLAAHLFEDVARRCRGVAGGILELYGGVGALSLFLAASGEPLRVVEGDPRSVRAARENARSNGLEGIRFQAEEVGRALRGLETKRRRYGVVVLDPPRSGLPQGSAARVARLATSKILYLSCDPATLARDLRGIAAGGEWRLEEIVPVDLFPQTAGIECLAELRLARGA